MKDEGRGLRLAFVTVGDPARLTGGYLYHREVFARLRASGVVIDEVVASAADLDAQLAAAATFGRAFDPPAYAAVVVDALACAVCAPWLDRWRAARPLVAMVHELPSVAGGMAMDQGPGARGQGPGPSEGRRLAALPALAGELAREAALLRADALIAVSDDGARILAERGVPPERIVVASGGLDRLKPPPPAQPPAARLASAPTKLKPDREPATSRLPAPGFSARPQVCGRGSRASGLRPPDAHAPASYSLAAQSPNRPIAQSPPLTLLTVAQWIPRKGMLELARVWARVARPGRRLELVGEDNADPAYAALVREALAAAPADTVVVHGPVDDAALAAAYARAALFVLPSHYEGYGIAFAEALAHGLPLVACGVGPVPALVGPDAGLLVPPGDEVALAAALTRLLDDEALRGQMAGAALARAAALPTWDSCAARFLSAVQAAISARAAEL